MKTTNFVRQLQARSVAHTASSIGHHYNHQQPHLSASAAAAAIAQPKADGQLEQTDAQECLKELQELQWKQNLEQEASSNNNNRQQWHQQATNGERQRVYERDQLDLSFNDARSAYKSKSMRDLLRNYFVLGLCKSDLLVRNNEKLMKTTRAIMGRRAFQHLMRATFYGQFVAGEDEQEIVPVIKHLSSFGVKTILDYSAEEDVAEEEVRKDSKPTEAERSEMEFLSHVGGQSHPLRRYQQSADFADRRKYLPVARTYFYHGESQCERNLEVFFKAVEAVAQATSNTGFAAIKLTALGRPRLLMKLSKIIDYMRSIEGRQQTGGAKPVGQRPESLSELLKRFNSLNQNHINPLDEDEEEMLFNLMRRVNRIAAYASQVGGARCMIDAEQTYMQPAINAIAMELMRQYNRREPIIFNTYQCYLKSAFDQVQQDLAQARRENFFFGAKLVRGAYMDQERARAAKLGYEDPINESFEATSRMYEKTLSYLMGEIERELKFAKQQQRQVANEKQQALDESNSRRVSIMVASHNEDTVRYTLEQMKLRGIEPWHRVICFGQLYGMCDHVSFMLGQSGYSVYKYTPYGPIDEVLPYLGRRAIENHGFLSKLERERSLLGKEILTRLATLRWFQQPIGNYKPA